MLSQLIVSDSQLYVCLAHEDRKCRAQAHTFLCCQLEITIITTKLQMTITIFSSTLAYL